MDEREREAVLSLDRELDELIKKYMGAVDPQRMVGVLATRLESVRLRMVFIKIRELEPAAF